MLLALLSTLVACSGPPPTDAEWLAEGKLPPGFEAKDETVWLIEEAVTDTKLGTLLPAQIVATGTTEEREDDVVVKVGESQTVAPASSVLRSCGEVNAPDLDAWLLCDDRAAQVAVRLADGALVYGLPRRLPSKDAPNLDPEDRIRVIDIDGDGTSEWLSTQARVLHESYETLSHRSVYATLVRPQTRSVAFVGSGTETMFEREALATLKEGDRFKSGTLRIGPDGTQSETVFFHYTAKGWTRGEAYRTDRGLDGTVLNEEQGEPQFLIDGKPTSVLMMTSGTHPRAIVTNSTEKAWEFSMSELDPKRVVAPHRGLATLLGTQGSPTELILVEPKGK